MTAVYIVLAVAFAIHGGVTLKVLYKHPRPANFEQATGVVAIGRHKGAALQAEGLLVKCPSKYEEQYGSGSSGGTSK